LSLGQTMLAKLEDDKTSKFYISIKMENGDGDFRAAQPSDDGAKFVSLFKKRTDWRRPFHFRRALEQF
jgi:arylamine N-acetyltransferase